MSTNVYTSDVTVDNASRDQLVESIRLREQRLAAGIDEQGSPKMDRIALVGGGLLVAVATIGFFASRGGRG